MDYLRENGFQVEPVMTDDVGEIKDRFGVPQEMQSCHTSIVGDYYIEGHVPVEAIRQLLDERPAIRGIALPGMPQGSPGMGGEKTEPFVIYAIAGGVAREYVTV